MKKIIIPAVLLAAIAGAAALFFLLDSHVEISDGIKRNEQFINQWGLYNNGQEIDGTKGTKNIDINILKAWEITKGSGDVIVGVLDSGLDRSCAEIQGSIYTNKNEIPGNNIDDDQNGFVDDINGWNFFHNNNELYNDYLHDNHGTYISSIIAASHSSGAMCGVAPQVKILPLKFLHGTNGQTADAVRAIEYAHSMGASIINCSWDSTAYDQELFDTMKKYSDILFVCSAGKQGADLDEVPVYPACYDLPNVLSVAAVDNKGALYEFSGYGQKAHIGAPGVNILSALPEGDYSYSDGTSSAAAFVTGAAALVKSYRSDLTAAEIADIIKHSSKRVRSFKGKIQCGGIVDAYKCLQNAEKY